MLSKELMKHRAEFARYMDNKQYEVSEEGVYFPKSHAIARGVYVHDVNGQDERFDKNILPTEGLNHMLDVALHAITQVPAWYLGLFSANTAPLATWTAANVTANSTEITS